MPSQSGTVACLPIAGAPANGDVAHMNLALFLLLPASAATDLTPPQASTAGLKTYEAVVVTEKTPVASDLTKPAVFIDDGSAKPVVGQSGTRWIV